MKVLHTLIERQDDIKKIADCYGLSPQRAQAVSELGELLAELGRELTVSDSKLTANSLKEMADVFIMITQLAYFADTENSEGVSISDEINYKIDRQIRRMAARGKSKA